MVANLVGELAARLCEWVICSVSMMLLDRTCEETRGLV